MKTEIKSFTDVNGMELIVQSRKSGIVFGVGASKEVGHKHRFKFSPEVFQELFTHLEVVSNKAWDKFKPQVATSEASDYDEYYDRPLDNNGYLSFDGDSGLYISRPSTESSRLYKFTKRKMESFIYDFRKKLGVGDGYFCSGIDFAAEGTKSKTIINGKEVD